MQSTDEARWVVPRTDWLLSEVPLGCCCCCCWLIVCAKFKTKTRSLLFVENEHSLIRYSLHPLFDVDRIMEYESIWSLNFKNSTAINYTLGLQKLLPALKKMFDPLQNQSIFICKILFDLLVLINNLTSRFFRQIKVCIVSEDTGLHSWHCAAF